MGNGLDMDLAGPRAGRPGHSRLRRDAVGAGRPVSAPRELFDSAANSRRALRAWGDRRGGVPTPTLRVAVTGTPISRRRALALITLGGASLAAGAAGWVAGLGAPGARGRLLRGRAEQLLTQPTVLASRNGVLRVRLTAAADVWLAGRHTTALGFNGTSPGPTLRVRPGALLQVRLVNHLDQRTNLHTHGLHVSPEDHGDNPFVTIDPGATFDYTYRIPTSHPAGTFWYHPHHHGHVADQIFGGLAGALLVDPGLDLPVTRDRVLVITDTTLDAAGRVADVSAMDRMMGREGELVLVNGQHQPRIATTPGAAERWRIINGCTSRVLALRLDGHNLTQVALDGNFLPTPADRNLVVLAPGNRTDLIIRPTSVPAGVTSGTADAAGSAYRPPPTDLRHGHGPGWDEVHHRRPHLRPHPRRPHRTTGQHRRLDDHQHQPHGSPLSPARVALPRAGRQHPNITDRHPAGRRAHPSPRLGAPAHPFHRLPRPQRLPLPHPRPRRRRHDGHRQRTHLITGAVQIWLVWISRHARLSCPRVVARRQRFFCHSLAFPRTSRGVRPRVQRPVWARAVLSYLRYRSRSSRRPRGGSCWTCRR